MRGMYGDLGCTYWMASASAQAVLGTFAVGEDSGDDCGIGYVGDDLEDRMDLKGFLIVATYRSGSSALAERIGLHPQIACGWESTMSVPVHRKLAIGKELLAGDLASLEADERAQIEQSLTPDTRMIGYRRLFRASDKWLGSLRFSPALWVDRLEAHLAWWRANPAIAIVHIVRGDNLAWLRSLASAKTSGSFFGQAYPEDLEFRFDLHEAEKRVVAKHFITGHLDTLRATNPYHVGGLRGVQGRQRGARERRGRIPRVRRRCRDRRRAYRHRAVARGARRRVREPRRGECASRAAAPAARQRSCCLIGQAGFSHIDTWLVLVAVDGSHRQPATAR